MVNNGLLSTAAPDVGPINADGLIVIDGPIKIDDVGNAGFAIR
jgi:hypothetical protein